MKFGLMFFASSEDALSGDKYRLVLESARYGDRNGFSTVWVPERHFTKFGSLYPNPAVLHAALAVATERIRLHAGSVVGPLHHPMRIAEEWSVVDNLSHGRAGISFAPGWNPDDFAFFPERYAKRHEEMLTCIASVRRLWRGETIEVTSGSGEPTRIRLYPTPVQRELPLWITAAGNPQSFVRAGELGFNLLTHVLDQDEEQLSRKITLYRRARAAHGFDPAAGIVSVMLHTFVGEDAAEVREQAREPFCQYLKNNFGLLNGLARSRGQQVDLQSMSPADLDDFTGFLYERFASSRGLIGTPESCRDVVDGLSRTGVDEIACLLDFGPPADLILANLPHLCRLKDAVEGSEPRRAPVARREFAAHIVQSRCTESLTGAAFDVRLRKRGIEISGAFECIEHIWRGDGESLGRVRMPATATPTATPFQLHPAMLDACSRVLAAALPSDIWNGEQSDLFLPAQVRSLRVHAPLASEVWSHGILRPVAGEEGFDGEVRIYDDAGRLLVEVEGLRLRRVDSPVISRAEINTLIYKRIWVRDALEESALAAHALQESGNWLLFMDRKGVGERLAALLEAGGSGCLRVYAGDDVPVAEQLREWAATPWRGIVHLWSLDAPPTVELTTESLQRAQALNTASVLRIVQEFDKLPEERSPRLWIVTSGAVPVDETEALAVAQSPLWGLGRVVALEHPRLWGALVDLDNEATNDRAATEILSTIREHDGEDMLAFRRGRRHVARIVRDVVVRDESATTFSADTTYLITGGLGGLGLQIARWMTRRGARHLALVGRHPPETTDAGRIFRADVGCAPQLAGVLEEIARTMPPLKGVFHLSGTLDDALLAAQSWQRFRDAASAKIEGAWNLHLLTRKMALDYFVMFSSMASLVPEAGQGNYASANAFLDALAHHRRSVGEPALSVNWGPWADVGHAATPYGHAAHARLAGMGIGAIPPELGLAALDRLMSQNSPQSAVIRINWSRFAEADPAAAQSPQLSELIRRSTTSLTASPEHSTEITDKLRALPESDRVSFLMSYLSDLVGRVLRLTEATPIAPRQGLFDLGLDSIMALELKTKLEAGLGRPFRATLLFTHPTLESLTDHLLREVIFVREPEPEFIAEAVEPATESPLDEEEDLERLILQEIGEAGAAD